MIELVHDAAQPVAPPQAPGLPPALLAAWWPLDRLGDGLQALAQATGLAAAADSGSGRAAPEAGVPPAGLAGDIALATRWLGWAADRLGLELEPVDTAVPAVDELLRAAGPALVPLADGRRGMGFVLLLGGRRPRLLAPDLRRLPLPRAALRQALVAHHEAPLRPGIEALLQAAGVPPRRRAAATTALLAQRLAGVRLAPWWLLRLPAQADMARQMRQARLPQRLLVLLGLSALLYAAETGAWGLIGAGVLDGRLAPGWLAAWVLLLAVMLPLQLAGGAVQAGLGLVTARLLKSRLLAGALRMDVDALRSQGVGALLGRVIESQALESMVVGGGLGTLVALVELAFAAGVLALGAAPGPHLGLLAFWLLLVMVLSGRWGRRLHDWTLGRLTLTQDLVEQMVGHRTRLAQQRASRRDHQDDAALHGYLQRSTALDASALPLQALLPAAWLMAALALLAPALAGGVSGALAVSLGGVLLAQRAFGGLAGGLGGLARAGIAWGHVGALFRAGRRPAGEAPPRFVDHDPARPAARAGAPLVDARGLQAAYEGGPPVLRGLDLRIASGDRVLLLGPSGGGKSTLGALLAGLRRPQSGLLLLQGLDAPTLGSQWHALATAAPQFHENHVLSGSLAFNLLMGREWPAGEAARAEALALCRELGLGALIDRMPAGLDQRIGETGWQLSHGERSRLFLARALLQKAPLTVLDESFAALDPETLAQCLRVVTERAQTLVVIAHP